MAASMVATALLLGPRVFDDHFHEAHAQGADLYGHAEEAFRSAGAASLAVGLLIAVLAASTVGVTVARRIGRALDAVADGASRVASGDYATPVTIRPSGRELDSVAATFNAMAAQIDATETARRRLLTDLSHEMRTPVAVIDVTLEALEDGVRVWDAEALAVLREQTGRLTRLAADLRDVSAAQEGRLEVSFAPVDLRDVTSHAAASARSAYAAASVHLATRLPEQEVLVEADRARLGQVLDNLLRNARQHTPPGGTVHLDLTLAPGHVTITVRDDGVGITPDALPHLFERFYRAGTERRDERPGTGVGLSISRALVEAHGGTLTAASDGPGTGARFDLTLPLH